MYVKITNGSVDTYPYSIGQLRRDNPNTSFPKKIPNETLASYGVYPVLQAPKPEPSGEYKTIVANGVTTDANGNWVNAWKEQDMFSDYTDEDGTVHTKAEQEADYTARKTAEAEAAVRTKRDSLLAETDWMGLSDVTMSAEMATYRQALRDITSHANFPHLEDSDYPTKPE